jgi:hypothetical protein
LKLSTFEFKTTKKPPTKMKFVVILLLAFVVAAIASPTSVSDNNIGDIVTVGVNANLEVSNQVDQTIVNVLLALLNQQAVVVAPSDASSS